jgi:DNA primase
MAGKIPQDFIDNLLAKTDIVEVINRRVPLKKKGREHTACCPFHSEKTPSFTVSQEKQFYHCFGCGAHGSAIGFLMEYDNLDFVEAIETLASDLGLDVPREQGGIAAAPQENLQAVYALLDNAATYYQQSLKSSPEAVAYLRDRGVSGEIARDFSLGYAPPGWDNLLQHLGGRYDNDLLLKAGLVSRNDSGKTYDKFRERIMFPIRDRRGRVIAFGGRILHQGEPKYLNSPETPVFNKSDTLYGLHEARKSSSRLDHLIVVEGYMDVVALAQYGIRNAVATLGTATTTSHVRQLFRVVPRIIFCFDGDRAGREAAWRALGNSMGALRDGQEIDFLFLPDGEDPDSFVRLKGTEYFNHEVANAQPLSSYLLESLKSRHNTASMEGRTSLMLEAGKLLTPLHEGLLRSQIESALEKLTSIAPAKPTISNASPPPRQRINPGIIQVTPMRLIIATLLQHPELAILAFDKYDPMISVLPGHELLQQILDAIREKPDLSPAMLIERFRDSRYAGIVNKLSTWQPPITTEDEDDNGAQQLDDAFERLRAQAQTHRLEVLLNREAREGKPLTSQEKEELLTLLRQ